MYTGFCHIGRIDEEGDGLRLTFKEGPTGLLRKDHPEFKRLCDLLQHLYQETQTRGVPPLTWIALDDAGVIKEVRLVLQGIPLSATRDDSGGYLIVFPFTNVSRRLSPDHPRFREYERYLLAALETETPLHFVNAAGNFYVIGDLLPAAAA
jgi:hypothetical protein